MSEVFKWKPGWAESRERYRGWWNQTDSVLVTGPVPRPESRLPEVRSLPVYPRTDHRHYTDIETRILTNHYLLASQDFPGDTLPLPNCDIGPGSLALFLGSEPGFAESTVWFDPYRGPETDPSSEAPFVFDSDNPWWRLHRDTLIGQARLGGDDYPAACQDLVENIDIIAALRDPQQLLIDMIAEPDWVERKVAELNAVWFEVYDRIFGIISQNGASCFHAFHLWGEGRTAKVQCDASAMFSPAMFERFVIPALTEQCSWLDNSLFHLDGHQCLAHLDLLLGIPDLNGIEWTPDPTVPSGGSPEWYDLYKRILDAGKSVQAVGVNPDEVVPLLKAVGHRGMFIITRSMTPNVARELVETTRALRR